MDGYDCMHQPCWVIHSNKSEQALETALVTRFDISLLVLSIPANIYLWFWYYAEHYTGTIFNTAKLEFDTICT